MAEYAFLTRWHIGAPLEAVWNEIYRGERWTQWWKGLERVETLSTGDAQDIGSVRRFTWKSLLPYRLVVDMRTVQVEPPTMLELHATGELAGTGIWRLSREGEGTLVQYEWNVKTTKPWMNILAPIARPLFSWNHDILMRWGESGLKHLLEVSS